MRPTRARELLVVAAVLLVAVALLLRHVYADLPPLPRFAPASLGFIALAELLAASSTTARLDGRPRTKPILPIVVARLAALGKASAVAGAAIGGAWAGALVYLVPKLGAFDTVGHDVIVGALGLVGSALLLFAGLRLEGACRARPPEEGWGSPRSPGRRPRGRA